MSDADSDYCTNTVTLEITVLAPVSLKVAQLTRSFHRQMHTNNWCSGVVQGDTCD